jgi:hypothetical protein
VAQGESHLAPRGCGQSGACPSSWSSGHGGGKSFSLPYGARGCGKVLAERCAIGRAGRTPFCLRDRLGRADEARVRDGLETGGASDQGHPRRRSFFETGLAIWNIGVWSHSGTTGPIGSFAMRQSSRSPRDLSECLKTAPNTQYFDRVKEAKGQR